MSNKDYRVAYETAAKELEQTLAEQEKLEQRVLTLRRTLNVLSTLCQQEGIDTTEIDRQYGRLLDIIESTLTDDIYKIVRNSPVEFTAKEILEELNKLGFSMGDQANPLATVHAILNRLTEGGKVKETIKDGKKAWIRYKRFSDLVAQKMKSKAPLGKISDMNTK